MNPSVVVSGPKKKKIIQQLKEQLFNHVIFLEQSTKLNINEKYIFLDNIESIHFDLNYFVTSAGESPSILLQYDLNHGQDLFSIDDQFNITDISIHDLETHDGFTETGIYLLTGESINKFHQLKKHQLKGIPVPINKNEISPQIIRPALFLDRDGVINMDKEYIHKIDDIEFISGIIEIIKYANENNWHVFVISNQSGVARNFFTEKDVLTLHKQINEILNKNGVQIDRWEYCPFHEKEGIGKYKKKSILRKPSPGLSLMACKNMPVDINKSFMVGDKPSDAIQLPGITNLHIRGKYPFPENQKNIFNTHHEILEYIQKNKK